MRCTGHYHEQRVWQVAFSRAESVQRLTEPLCKLSSASGLICHGICKLQLADCSQHLGSGQAKGHVQSHQCWWMQPSPEPLNASNGIYAYDKYGVGRQGALIPARLASSAGEAVWCRSATQLCSFKRRITALHTPKSNQ